MLEHGDVQSFPPRITFAICVTILAFTNAKSQFRDALACCLLLGRDQVALARDFRELDGSAGARHPRVCVDNRCTSSQWWLASSTLVLWLQVLVVVLVSGWLCDPARCSRTLSSLLKITVG